MKKCLWCEKNLQNCWHYFPYELKFFLKMRAVCKQWRDKVDEFLKLKGAITVSYECECCTHTFTYKKSIEDKLYDRFNRDPRDTDRLPPRAKWFYKGTLVLNNGYRIETQHKKCEANYQIQKKLKEIREAENK